MENVFLDLLYQKEFKSKLIDRIKNYFRYRKLIRKLKKNPPSFDTLWQFAEYIKWADFIYGLDSTNTDIDLLKKRNSYIVDQSTGEVIEISFTLLPDDRTKIHFKLEQEYHMISIDILRDRMSNSDDKISSISFSADDKQFVFSYEDQLMICNINRILKEIMVKYTSLFYNKIK